MVGDATSRVRCIDSPALDGAVTGVRDLDDGPDLSPNLTNVSIDFSRLPFRPLRIVAFRFSSINPISRSCASFMSMSSELVSSKATVAPKTLEGLFRLGGLGDR